MFPLKLDVGLSTLSPDVYRDGGVHVDIRVGDGHRERGILYCEAMSGLMSDLVVGRKTRQWEANGEQSACRIDGTLLPRRLMEDGNCWDYNSIAFEGDEYVILGSEEFRF